MSPLHGVARPHRSGELAGESCSVGGAIAAVRRVIVGVVIRRFPHSSNRAVNSDTAQSGDIPEDFYRKKLAEALGAGVAALNDPEIETRVEAYFRENPTFSRDAVHVAAVACQFKKGQIKANRG